MTDDLTPAEKRRQTMQARYGENWGKHITKLSIAAKIDKRGEDGFKAKQSEAGKAGGGKTRPATRPFKNKSRASEAGKKGSDARWKGKA